MLLKNLPQRVIPRTTNNMLYEIKKLVAEKRRARSIWQRTQHQTAEEHITDQATNLNPNSKKCVMNPLIIAPLISKGKITLFGNP